MLLRPIAALSNRMDPWRRLWAHARLRAALGSRLDPSVVVLGMPELHGSKDIRLGKDLYLYPALYLETREQGRIEIGDGVVLSRGVHIVSYASVILEDGVMVGEYTSIRDANHRIAEGRSVRDTGHDARPIRVGRNAWIGRGATLLRGVTIGESAVIGANAVVTHDVPAHAVVAGVPARPIERTRGG